MKLLSMRAFSWLVGAGLAFSLATRAGADNGSSGVGNARVAIGQGLSVLLPRGYVVPGNQFLVDPASGQSLFAIKSIRESDFTLRGPDEFWIVAGNVLAIEVTRGGVDGWTGRSVAWRVCSPSQPGRCYELEALHPTSPKTAAVIGALQ